MGNKKLFAAMARNPAITSQEFHDHYRHPHGTMGMQISTLRKYVQSHQIHTELLLEEQEQFEAVAELWFENGSDMIHFREESIMATFLNDDEPNFCDLRKTRLFIGEEEVLNSMPNSALTKASRANEFWRLDYRPLSIKIIQFILPTAGSEWCGENDESLGHRLGAFRHVRSHPTTPTTIVSDRVNRPPDYIGVRELWWPTFTAFEKSVKKDLSAWDALILRPNTYSMLAQAEQWR